MKKEIRIELHEDDVNNILIEYIKTHYKNIEIINMDYITGVRGDWDMGDAKPYVKSVQIVAKNK